MKSTDQKLRAKEFIRILAAEGRYSFDSAEARKALDVSADAAKLALLRLKKDQAIASPARGFYVIVPPEYLPLGSLPADQFVPALMQRAALRYYVGLLSAAQYHGSAHHRPQELQVMVPKPRRLILVGRVRVRFFVRSRLHDVATQFFNTPRGTILVSTPEATALDLVGYQQSIGGLDHIATVLAELASMLNPTRLADSAKAAPLPWAQRLGFLLEQVGAAKKVKPLKSYVEAVARQSIPLLPGASTARSATDHKWKVAVNAEVEAEA